MLKIKKLPASLYVLYSAVIALGILADHVSKVLAVKYLLPVSDFPIIRDVFHLTYVENRGAAFGMMADRRWVFIVFSAVAILALTAYLYIGGFSDSKLSGFSVAMIISGGIGNMIERLGRGYVVDFINFEVIDIAVFNLADSFICVGAGLLVLALVIEIVKEEKDKKKNAGN
ncbi:MAG: signal peptidase II [Clostridia bacterium]|nr:signal peptidase II [Clostridia bacterium]